MQQNHLDKLQPSRWVVARSNWAVLVRCNQPRQSYSESVALYSLICSVVCDSIRQGCVISMGNLYKPWKFAVYLQSKGNLLSNKIDFSQFHTHKHPYTWICCHAEEAGKTPQEATKNTKWLRRVMSWNLTRIGLHLILCTLRRWWWKWHILKQTKKSDRFANIWFLEMCPDRQ